MMANGGDMKGGEGSGEITILLSELVTINNFRRWNNGII